MWTARNDMKDKGEGKLANILPRVLKKYFFYVVELARSLWKTMTASGETMSHAHDDARGARDAGSSVGWDACAKFAAYHRGKGVLEKQASDRY
jgi:hypothetical protein